MAISFVGSAANSALNGGDVTITLPTMIENDLCIVVGGHQDSANAGVSTSGYTEIADFSGGANTTHWSVNWKIMGATPDTTVVGVGSGNSQSSVVYIAYCFRGQDLTTPIDATTTTATGNSTNPNPPSITTVTDQAWVFISAGSRVSDTTITVPTNYSNQILKNETDTSPLSTAAASRGPLSVGTEDPANWTTWSSSTWSAATVAIRPATAATNKHRLLLLGVGI